MTRTRTTHLHRAAVGVLLAVVPLLVMPSASAAGLRSWNLDRAPGQEIALANLGLAPRVVVVPGSRDGSRPGRARKIRAEDVGLTDFRDSQVDAGDIDGDGDGDLVISAPHARTSATSVNSGAIVVVPGSAGGPDSQDAYRIANPFRRAQELGRALVVADLDSDGLDDIVTSAVLPEGDAIKVFWGQPQRIRNPDTTFIPAPFTKSIDAFVTAHLHRRSNPQLVVVHRGTRRTGGRFVRMDFSDWRGHWTDGEQGRTPERIGGITTGDVRGNNEDEVLVGQPDSNRVLVYQWSASHFMPMQILSQASRGVPGSEDSQDRFGAALAAADVDHDGKDDVAIGAPGESLGGRVTFLYGHPDDLGRAGGRAVAQTTDHIPGADEAGDDFGAAVSLLDVDGSGNADLVIGVPGEDERRGSVVVVRTSGSGALRLRSAIRFEPADVGLANRDCCGRPRFGNRIGQ